MKYITVCLDDQEVEMGLKMRPILSKMYNRSFTKKQMLALYAEQKMALNENERRVHAKGAHTVKVRIPISEDTRTPLLDGIEMETFMAGRLARSLFINKVAKIFLLGSMIFLALVICYAVFKQ